MATTPATTPGTIRPPVDPTMSRYSLLYPIGVVPRTSLVDDYYGSSAAGVDPTRSGPSRSRSLSNATLDARDIRTNMDHSLTDLFHYSIEDPYEPLDFDNRFPYITHLYEAFRARDGNAPISRMKAGWHRIYKPRLITRPRPHHDISKEHGLVDCGETSLRLFSSFMPIATYIYLEIFAKIFGAGDTHVDFKHLASEAVHNAAMNKKFQAEYTQLSQMPLTLYLTNDATDNWQFDLGTVGLHGLSCFYLYEGVNFALQTGGEILNNCRQGARVILYRDPLLNHTSHETVYPPESHAPEIHASQARRILAQICGLTSAPPEGIKSSDIRPSLSYFLSVGVKNMMSGIIYSKEPEMFSLGVHYALRKMENGQRITPDGVRGRPWMTLNLLALGGCFIIVELARISGIVHVGGQDIRPAGSLYWFTTFEADIFTVCVQVLKAIYDKPNSPGGQALNGVLRLLESEWKFEWHYNKHEQALNSVKNNKSDFY